jgi:hypothetical protein
MLLVQVENFGGDEQRYRLIQLKSNHPVFTVWTGVETEVLLRSQLLPFEHKDVRLISACGVNGHGQRLKVGGKFDLLSVVDFAVASLVRQFECVLI